MTARSRFLWGYSVAWLPFAALYSFLIYWQSPVRSVAGALEGGIVTVATAAVLGLAVWTAIRRLAERPRSVWRWMGTHLALAAGYSASWNALTLGSIWLFAPRSVLEMYVRFALGWATLTGLILYGFLAGIAHAWAVGVRLRREREAAVRAEGLRAQAELRALRAQVNPHFLFNTLHSISALVRSEPAVVEDALERLALLLRRLLDSQRVGVDHWTLAEELEIVEDQLALEKLRFGDRLHVSVDIESDALECRVPVFTLQPLVENSIRHGVSAQTSRCTLTVTGRIVRDLLILEVADDGPGAHEHDILGAVGLGLRSVRQRLQAQYGDSGAVHIETVPGAGFLVQVALPIENAPPNRVEEGCESADKVAV